MKMEILVILVVSVTILFTYGCTNEQERNVFKKMHNSFIDLKIDSQNFFIKDFKFSSSPTKINSENYWEIKNDRSSFFHIDGYLRLMDDSIILIKSKKSSDPLGTCKLFDFSATPNTSWIFIPENDGNILLGDSIIYLGCKRDSKDSIYSFAMFPFHYFKANKSKRILDYGFIMNISKVNGFIDIVTFSDSFSDTLFFVKLNPDPVIVNKLGKRILL
jgi:hypothetical protein